MRIIVTGAAGFIGSNLIKALNDAGYDNIVAVDSFLDADQFRNLTCCRFTDLLTADAFLRARDKFTDSAIVFHQGAISSTTERDGLKLLQSNFEYSVSLLAWCQENGIRLIYASSAAVYGDGDRGFSADDAKCERPLNGYASSKWMIDQRVRSLLATKPRTQVVGLRYFNVYGRQELHKGGMCSPILHFHRQLTANTTLRLFHGSESYYRDFVSVEDCCRVNLFFLAHGGASGIFNCGTGDAHSFRDVADAMLPLYPNGSVEYVPFPEHLKGKYQRFTKADLGSLRRVGYAAPFTPMRQGVIDYVRCLLSQSGGYIEDD